jgi:hypothetical protein
MAEPSTPLPEHNDVRNALLDIKGALQLCQQAAANDTSGGEAIPAIDGTLTIAIDAIERLYDRLDSDLLREAWPAAVEDVARG